MSITQKAQNSTNAQKNHEAKQREKNVGGKKQYRKKYWGKNLKPEKNKIKQ